MKLTPPNVYRVQWPTREPRPKLWTDKRPSVLSMIRALLRPRKG